MYCTYKSPVTRLLEYPLFYVLLLMEFRKWNFPTGLRIVARSRIIFIARFENYLSTTVRTKCTNGTISYQISFSFISYCYSLRLNMKIGLIIYMIRGCVIFMKETSLKPVICLVIGYIYLHVTRCTKCTTLALQ